MRLQVPASNLAPAATVELDTDGRVSLDDVLIGVVWKRSASTWRPAAGHAGRIGTSGEAADWRALTVEESKLPSQEQLPYSGDVFRDARKNTRKAAIVYLLARHAGAGWSDARYFQWA